MTNPSIILSRWHEVPEGIMDAFINYSCALHDLKIKIILELVQFIL